MNDRKRVRLIGDITKCRIKSIGQGGMTWTICAKIDDMPPVESELLYHCEKAYFCVFRGYIPMGRDTPNGREGFVITSPQLMAAFTRFSYNLGLGGIDTPRRMPSFFNLKIGFDDFKEGFDLLIPHPDEAVEILNWVSDEYPMEDWKGRGFPRYGDTAEFEGYAPTHRVIRRFDPDEIGYFNDFLTTPIRVY